MTLPGSGADLLSFRAPDPRAALLVLPGALCRADRYKWLAALGGRGIDVHLLDGALSAGRFRSADGPQPVFAELAAALDHIAADGLPLHAAGHSAGAAALLDALDPPSNPIAHLPPGWRLPQPLVSVTSMGCSLQHAALDMRLAHRSDDRPLGCPAGMRLLFLAGDADAMAPPEQVRRTAGRYDPPVPVIALAAATHYGWAGPREPGDNPRSDADVSLDTGLQRARTLGYLAGMILRGAPAPIEADRRWN